MIFFVLRIPPVNKNYDLKGLGPGLSQCIHHCISQRYIEKAYHYKIDILA